MTKKANKTGIFPESKTISPNSIQYSPEEFQKLENLAIKLNAIFRSNPKKTYRAGQDILRENPGEICHQAFGHYLTGASANYLTLYNDALKALKKSNSLFRQMKQLFWICKVHLSMGMTYSGIGDFEKALGIYQQVQHLIEHNTEKKILEIKTKVLNNIGEIYRESGYFDTALIYYKKALSIAEENNWEIQIAVYMENMGLCYLHKNQAKKGMEYLNRSLEIFRSYNDLRGISFIMSEIAKIYLNEKKFDRAMKAFNEICQIGENMGSKTHLVDGLIGIAKVYSEKNDPEMAKKYIDQANEIAQGVGSDRIFVEIYKNYCLIYEKRKMYENAMEMAKKYKELKEKNATEQFAKKLNEFEIRYTLMEKEKESEVYELKNTLLKQKNKELKRLNSEVKKEINLAEKIINSFIQYDFSFSSGFSRMKIIQNTNTVLNSYFYDFTKDKKNRQNFFFAEILIQAIPAALLNTMLKVLFLQAVQNGPDLKDIMEKINDGLYKINKNRYNINLFIGQINIDDYSFHFINSGFKSPFLLSTDGKVKYFTQNSPLPGLEYKPAFNVSAVKIKENDRFILFSKKMYYTYKNYEKKIKDIQDFFIENNKLSFDHWCLAAKNHFFTGIRKETFQKDKMIFLTEFSLKNN